MNPFQTVDQANVKRMFLALSDNIQNQPLDDGVAALTAVLAAIASSNPYSQAVVAAGVQHLLNTIEQAQHERN